MHGVKREKKAAASIEARNARKAKEQAKIKAYLEVEEDFFRLRKQGIKTEDSLAHTTHLLTLNPELYSVWNYRREILLALFDAPLPSQAKQEGQASAKPDVFASLRADLEPPLSEEASPTAPTNDDQQQHLKRQRSRLLIERDLELTEHALRAHPKVYWIWNHRMWCLQNLPEDSDMFERGMSKWKVEMKLVDRMLELDPRNFHGWTYRRYLTSQLAATFLPPSSTTLKTTADSFPASLSSTDLPSDAKKAQLELAQSELQYTLRKIEANFSNFSAWHQRTKLLPHVWDAKGWDEGMRRKARDEEYKLVKQAMYTDPTDQSVWIYHRWLVEQDPAPSILARESEAIEELLELEPDSKWCMLSLAHYKTLLIDADTKSSTQEQEAEAARGEVEQLLERLINVDPDRANRYRDLLEGKGRF